MSSRSLAAIAASTGRFELRSLARQSCHVDTTPSTLCLASRALADSFREKNRLTHERATLARRFVHTKCPVALQPARLTNECRATPGVGFSNWPVERSKRQSPWRDWSDWPRTTPTLRVLPTLARYQIEASRSITGGNCAAQPSNAQRRLCADAPSGEVPRCCRRRRRRRDLCEQSYRESERAQCASASFSRPGSGVGQQSPSLPSASFS